MAISDTAYGLIQNGSWVEAANDIYQVTVGAWFWPMIFMVTLAMVYIKSENPAFVFIYAILGNVMLSVDWWFLDGPILPVLASPLSYVVLVISLALTLWKMYGSNKIE